MSCLTFTKKRESQRERWRDWKKASQPTKQNKMKTKVNQSQRGYLKHVGKHQLHGVLSSYFCLFL